MKVTIDEVGRLLATAASTHVSDQEARYFSDCIVASHLRKAPTDATHQGSHSRSERLEEQ